MGLLIKLDKGGTSLKSLKFGNDRPGGGDSGQPFIKKPIGEQGEFSSIDGDGILRGGIRAPLSAADDVSRLTKYLFNFKSPSGFLFTAKQNILSRIGVKTEATKGIAYVGSALNEGIYTPYSTLGQAGEGYIGGHLNKQGLDPTGAFPEATLKKYQDVITSNQLIGNPDLSNNRLIRLTQLIKNNKSESNFGFVKGYGLNIGENLISYSGGPGSTLGVDNTNIRFATDNTGVSIKSILDKPKDYLTGIDESKIDRNKFITPIQASERYIFLSPDGVRDFEAISSNPSTQNNLTKEGRKSFEYQKTNNIYTTTNSGTPTLNIDKNSNAINPIIVNQVRSRVAYSRTYERENKWIKPIGVSEAYNLAIGNGKAPSFTPIKFDLDYTTNPQGIHKYFDSWQSSATATGVYIRKGNKGDKISDPTLRVRSEVKNGTYLVGKSYSSIEEGKEFWVSPSSSKRENSSFFTAYPKDTKYFVTGDGKDEIVKEVITFGVDKKPLSKPKKEISRRISPLSKKSGKSSPLQPQGKQLEVYNATDFSNVSNLDGTDSYQPNLLLGDQYLAYGWDTPKVYDSDLRQTPLGDTPTSSSLNPSQDLFSKLDKVNAVINNDGEKSYVLPNSGYTPPNQEFLETLPGYVKNIRTTPQYEPQTQDGRFTSIRQERRIGIGDPGAEPGSTQIPLDKLTAKPITSSPTGDGPFEERDNANDFCHFRIGILDPESPDLSNYMNFRAFLSSISDSYKSQWKAQSYLGRGEKFYKYTGFDRDMSFKFTIVAQSQAEMNSMYTKLNYLASSLAPNYTPSGYMSGNIATITIGEYIYEQLAIINSLTYNIPDESPWELTIGKGSNLDELPHYIEVDVKFTPIHNFRPEIGNQNRFITHKLPFTPDDSGNTVAFDQYDQPQTPTIDGNSTTVDSIDNPEQLTNAQLLKLSREGATFF